MRELGLPKGTVKMWAFQFVSMCKGRFIHKYNSQSSQGLPNEEDVLAHTFGCLLLRGFLNRVMASEHYETLNYQRYLRVKRLGYKARVHQYYL